jgi:hypothetical protein
MTVEITYTQTAHILSSSTYWFTVEDRFIDLGCGGCTISYWELPTGENIERKNHICMNKQEALAIAEAIQKFFS